MTSSIYNMSARVLKMIKTKGNTKLTCYTCNRAIKLGQDVHSVVKPHKQILRHLSCAKKIGAV